MASITQQALRILEEEKQAALVEEQKRIASAKAEAAAKEQADRSARVQLQAERELARIAAERALAAEQALAQQAADARALQAELARLRARVLEVAAVVDAALLEDEVRDAEAAPQRHVEDAVAHVGARRHLHAPAEVLPVADRHDGDGQRLGRLAVEREAHGAIAVLRERAQ